VFAVDANREAGTASISVITASARGGSTARERFPVLPYP
jgi:hypothetical protein